MKSIEVKLGEMLKKYNDLINKAYHQLHDLFNYEKYEWLKEDLEERLSEELDKEVFIECGSINIYVDINNKEYYKISYDFKDVKKVSKEEWLLGIFDEVGVKFEKRLVIEVVEVQLADINLNSDYEFSIEKGKIETLRIDGKDYSEMFDLEEEYNIEAEIDRVESIDEVAFTIHPEVSPNYVYLAISGYGRIMVHKSI